MKRHEQRRWIRPGAEDAPNIDWILRQIVDHDDYAGLLDLRDELGDLPIFIRGTSEDIPVRTHRLGDIQAEVQHSPDPYGGSSLRFYFAGDVPFSIRSDTIQYIGLTASMESTP